MTDVTTTPFYQALAPRIRKQDRKEFARMLQMVEDRGLVYEQWTRTSLAEAFNWLGSPQKFGYWNALADRLGDNGGWGPVQS